MWFMIYDIFISYRRDGGGDTAGRINDLLTADGYSVSYDVDTMREGRFDTQLLERIKQCQDFILVVDKNCFVRTIDPDTDPQEDWLRQELSYALKLEKNIIPVLLAGASFPKQLPDDIKAVRKINAPTCVHEYFDSFYSKLKGFLHAHPRMAPISGPLTPPSPPMLKLKTDMDCVFYIDGEETAKLKAGELSKVPLPEGEYELKFVSEENAIVIVKVDKYRMPPYDTLLYKKLLPINIEQKEAEALEIIKEIIVSQGVCSNDENSGNNKTKYENRKWNIRNRGCNNRLLVIGDSENDKTSIMRYLADYLSKQAIIINSKDGEDDVKIKCYCLPEVILSPFDDNNKNFLQTIIPSMFLETKKKMRELVDESDAQCRGEYLLKQFSIVLKSLDSIKTETLTYTLESLNKKSDALDLKNKLKNLVDDYLNFQGCGKGSKLVLSIYDAHMAVPYTLEMLDQLRKYMELDNTIIIMSADMKQLTNEIREKYSSDFQYTLKDSNQALSIDIEDLTTKYLLKLFTTSRRINVEGYDDQLLKTD